MKGSDGGLQQHVPGYWVRTTGDGVTDAAVTRVWRVTDAGLALDPEPVARFDTYGRRERLEQHRKACRLAKAGQLAKPPRVSA